MEQKYNFENLVLLVGTNPLPNYVVGKYFLMNNPDLKKIWLVYSEKQNDFGTQEIAERIRDVFSKDFSNFGFCPLEKISDARDIKRNIETNILKKLSNSVHLNYTGGTKTMAVHVYRAIEKSSIGDKSYSYLDARKFVLIDDTDGEITDDLSKNINVNCKTFSFDTLINLHGYKKKREGLEYGEDWNGVLEEFKKLVDGISERFLAK